MNEMDKLFGIIDEMPTPGPGHQRWLDNEQNKDDLTILVFSLARALGLDTSDPEKMAETVIYFRFLFDYGWIQAEQDKKLDLWRE